MTGDELFLAAESCIRDNSCPHSRSFGGSFMIQNIQRCPGSKKNDGCFVGHQASKQQIPPEQNDGETQAEHWSRPMNEWTNKRKSSQLSGLGVQR